MFPAHDQIALARLMHMLLKIRLSYSNSILTRSHLPTVFHLHERFAIRKPRLYPQHHKTSFSAITPNRKITPCSFTGPQTSGHGRISGPINRTLLWLLRIIAFRVIRPFRHAADFMAPSRPYGPWASTISSTSRHSSVHPCSSAYCFNPSGAASNCQTFITSGRTLLPESWQFHTRQSSAASSVCGQFWPSPGFAHPCSPDTPLPVLPVRVRPAIGVGFKMPSNLLPAHAGMFH